MNTILTVNLAAQTSSVTNLTTEQNAAMRPDEGKRPVPVGVRNTQFKAWLELNGMMQDALDYLAAIPDPDTNKMTLLWWNNEPGFGRYHTYLIDLVAGLGMTSEETDEAFRVAFEYP